MGGPEMMAAQMAMQFMQGLQERSSLRGQADAIDENARIEETQGGYDAVQALRESRMQEGADISAAAASGTGLTGSVADVLFQSAVERQMEAMGIRAEAGMRARSLRAEATAKRKAGDQALFGGVLRAGASAIGGVSAQRDQAALGGAMKNGRLVQKSGTIPIPWGTTGHYQTRGGY
jgi:hypothetical protein